MSKFTIVGLDKTDKAIEVINKRKIDLVIFDAHEKDSGQFDFLARLKMKFPGLKIFVISGKDSLIRGGELLAEEYVRKPFNIHRMRRLIEKHFEPIEKLERILESWPNKSALSLLNRTLIEGVEATEAMTIDDLYLKSTVYKMPEQPFNSYSLGVCAGKGCRVKCAFCRSHEGGEVRPLRTEEIICQGFFGMQSSFIWEMFKRFGEKDDYDLSINSTCGADAILMINPKKKKQIIQSTVEALGEIIRIPGLKIRPIITTTGDNVKLRYFRDNYLKILPNVEFYLSVDFLDPVMRAKWKRGLECQDVYEIAKELSAISALTGIVNTLNYVLIATKNDSRDDARRLGQFAKAYGMKVKIQGLTGDWLPKKLKPSLRSMRKFNQMVRDCNVDSRWRDVGRGASEMATCGSFGRYRRIG